MKIPLNILKLFPHGLGFNDDIGPNGTYIPNIQTP
jgi:hypothetical protein